jgi:hypothetical protein
MASPITRITELFNRVVGREAPAPAPAPASDVAKPEAAKPEPVTKTVS